MIEPVRSKVKTLSKSQTIFEVMININKLILLLFVSRNSIVVITTIGVKFLVFLYVFKEFKSCLFCSRT